MNWIDVAPVRDWWQALITAVTNSLFPQHAWNFLTSWWPASFSGRTLLYWVKYCYCYCYYYYYYCIVLHNPSSRTWYRVDSASNLFGGKRDRCLELTILHPSIVDCFAMWEPPTPGALRACPGLYSSSFNFYFLLLFKSQIIPRNIKINFTKRWLDPSAYMKQ